MNDPTQKILSIFEMVRNTYTIAHLDDFEAPRCEDNRHGTDTENHAGGAEFLFVSPCPHGTGYVCGPFATWLTSREYAHCARCKKFTPVSELTFIPIGGQK